MLQILTRPDRAYEARETARELLRRGGRLLLVALGLLIVLIGLLLAPLPGPTGAPVVVIGLMIVLRNSFRARREFVKFQHRHPRMLFPVRRLLRRHPEIVPVAWQQVLRIERMLAPRRWRVAKRLHRRFRPRR